MVYFLAQNFSWNYDFLLKKLVFKLWARGLVYSTVFNWCQSFASDLQSANQTVREQEMEVVCKIDAVFRMDPLFTTNAKVVFLLQLLVIINESWHNQAYLFLIIQLWSPISTFSDEKLFFGTEIFLHLGILERSFGRNKKVDVDKRSLL